jgi:hypothetical protein
LGGKGDFNNRDEALLPHIGYQSHEAGTLDCILDGPLESSAIAAAFAAEELALAVAQLFQGLHVLVIDKGWPRAAIFGAKTAAVFPASPQLLPNHQQPLSQYAGEEFATEKIRILNLSASVNEAFANDQCPNTQ